MTQILKTIVKPKNANKMKANVTNNTASNNILKSQVFKKAWSFYRQANNQLTWSNCVKLAWQYIKNQHNKYNINKLYTMYYKQVFNFVKSKGFNEFDSNEITNDSFIKAYSNLYSFDDSKGQFITWLFTIVRNNIIDFSRSKTYLKSKATKQISDYQDSEGREYFQIESSQSFDSDYSINQNQTKKVVLSAIKQLKNNDMKRIAYLFFIKNCKYIDIAEMTGINLNTIKVYILRLRESLQAKLKPCYN